MMKIFKTAVIICMLAVVMSQNSTANTTNITVTNTTNPTSDASLTETSFLIPELANLTSTDECIKKHSTILSYMQTEEQQLFFTAYQNRNTTESRCFNPSFFKNSFLNVTKKGFGKFNKLVSDNSKSVRQSLSCIVKTFTAVASSDNTVYQNYMNVLVDSQGQTNQCFAAFLTILENTLNARRKYLLLNGEVQKNASFIDFTGKIVSFPWTQEEVNIITPAFIDFANCYSALPNTLTSMVADIQTALAADPNCAPTTTARLLGMTRFLQASTATPTTTTPTTTPTTTNTTTTNTTTPTTTNTTTTNTTTPTSTNTTTTNTTTPTSTNTTTTNTTTPTTTNTTTTNTTTPTTTNTTTTNTTKSDDKGKSDKGKKKSIADVTINTDLAAYIADVQANIKNSSEILYNSLATAVNSTTKKIKCDFVGVLSSSIKNGDQLKIMKNQYTLAKSKKPCNDTFIVYATNAAAAGAGFIGCVSGCEVKPIEWKSNKVLEYFTAAAGCVNGKRFAFAYSKDKTNGEFFDFVAPQYNICSESAGQANQCAKYYANLGKASNTLRYLETSTTPATTTTPTTTTTTTNTTTPSTTSNTTTTNTTTPTTNTTTNTTTPTTTNTTSNTTTTNTTTPTNTTSTNTTTPTTNTTTTNTTTPVAPTTPTTPTFDTNNCVTSMKSTCQSAFNKFCKDSGLFNSIGSLVPSSTGSNLPVDCQNIDATNPDYNTCFKWIAKNIIRNSLFPRYSAIAQIQTTIVNSQATAPTLRYLQNSEPINIVATDPTTADTAAQLNSTVYAVTDAEANIDGSTGTSQAATDAQVNNITVDNSTVANNTGSNSGNYLTVSSFVLFVLALLI
jgi:hypothetical protein